MGIGTGIFLFVVGAVLAFALNIEVSWVDLDLVGFFLMGAGFLVSLISTVMMARKRSTTSTVRHIDNGGAERVTQRETRSDSDPLV